MQINNSDFTLNFLIYIQPGIQGLKIGAEPANFQYMCSAVCLPASFKQACLNPPHTARLKGLCLRLAIHCRKDIRLIPPSTLCWFGNSSCQAIVFSWLRQAGGWSHARQEKTVTSDNRKRIQQTVPKLIDQLGTFSLLINSLNFRQFSRKGAQIRGNTPGSSRLLPVLQTVTRQLLLLLCFG